MKSFSDRWDMIAREHDPVYNRVIFLAIIAMNALESWNLSELNALEANW